MRWVAWIVSASLGLVLSAQAPDFSDPVLRARAERAAAQGIPERELPPVTQGLVDPPPLPPPETHVRDLRRATKGRVQRSARTVKRGKTQAVTTSKRRAPKPRRSR